MAGREPDSRGAASGAPPVSPRRVPCGDKADRLYCSALALRFAHEAGLARREAGRVALCVAELVSNVARHARDGDLELDVAVADRDGVPSRAVRVVVRDRGPGLSDVELAVRDGWSQGRALAPEDPRGQGLGKGLGAVLRVMDSVRIEARPGEGTTVTALKFVR